MPHLLTGGFGGSSASLLLRGFLFSAVALDDELPPPYAGTRAAGTDITLLEETVINALFTDRRALDGDDLPFAPDDRRGWWADAFIGEDGPVGSRLWLLDRSKTTAERVRAAKQYVEEALAYLVEDGVATSITVEAERFALEAVGVVVTITRDLGADVVLRFDDLWAELGI